MYDIHHNIGQPRSYLTYSYNGIFYTILYHSPILQYKYIRMYILY